MPGFKPTALELWTGSISLVAAESFYALQPSGTHRQALFKSPVPSRSEAFPLFLSFLGLEVVVLNMS